MWVSCSAPDDPALPGCLHRAAARHGKLRRRGHVDWRGRYRGRSAAEDLSVAGDIVVAAGHKMMVVAPSKKASMAAAEEIGAEGATTAAGLAFAHGFRWDQDGVYNPGTPTRSPGPCTEDHARTPN